MKLNYAKKAKRICRAAVAVLLLVTVAVLCVPIAAYAEGGAVVTYVAESVPAGLDPNCRSALLMDAATGTVLYEKNADEALPPASVTKVMTLLLVMEAIEAGKISFSDTVTASGNACSMGGSQIFLEEGEQMSVEDMLKSVVIASANDAAVALAEHICGTEEAFVEQMNKRSAELGMKNTYFENTNGLDDTVERHLTSARDIALMSRELIKHKKILEYSSIWMDSIRGGAFGLTNTNRLVRYYKGATGLKTGSTSKAGFCISATAERGGMSLICVIMGAPSRDIRNSAATSLLDYGFASFGLYSAPEKELSGVPVLHGMSGAVDARALSFSCVLPKADIGKVKAAIALPEELEAPVAVGDVLGSVVYTVGAREIGRSNIIAAASVEKITYAGALILLLRKCAQIM